MKHAAAALALLALGLSPQQQRGKNIYLRGESPSPRPITATLGAGMDPVPAAIVPCANCHGEDGRGKAEGGVRPADISPESLARAATVNERTRPRYTKPLLKRAITMGIDSGRRELDAAMPRYQMTMADAGDLLAYLDVLGHEPQPGVTADALRIKVVGDAVSPATTQRIYGRTIEVVHDGEAFLTIDATEDPAASLAAAERDHIPTIVLHSPAPITSPYAFSLTATEAGQHAALEKYAASLPTHPPPLLLTSSEAKRRDLATLPRDQRVIVAVPLPPSPQARHDALAAAMGIVTNLLAQLGRDVTRSALIAALEHVYRVETHTLPPITWSANRRHGTTAAWLMTLDVPSQRLLAEPGWVDGAP